MSFSPLENPFYCVYNRLYSIICSNLCFFSFSLSFVYSFIFMFDCTIQKNGKKCTDILHTDGTRFGTYLPSGKEGIK